MKPLALFALLLLLGARPAPARAWSEDGHVIVCKLAEAKLSAEAVAGIKELLDGRGISDPRLCTWADAIRSSGQLDRKYKGNDKWHYVNIELTSKLEDFRAGEDDVVGAVERFRKALADPSLDRESRKEALLFVIHFVGDMHQPLHCCHRDNDRGGNLQPVKSFEGRADAKLNLHAVWDNHMVRFTKGDLSTDDFVKRLDESIPDASRKAWAEGGVKDWAWDTHLAAVKGVYAFSDGTPFPAAKEGGVELTGQTYARQNAALVREQLQKGGVRLALVLNGAFAEK